MMVYQFAAFVESDVKKRLFKNHEKKCNGQTLRKYVNKEKSLDCELCELKFSSEKT